MIGIARSLASLLAAGLVLTGSGSAQAQTEVDLALVLAVDVSLSMEPDEQELQREGFVEASARLRYTRPSAGACWGALR